MCLLECDVLRGGEGAPLAAVADPLGQGPQREAERAQERQAAHPHHRHQPRRVATPVQTVVHPTLSAQIHNQQQKNVQQRSHAPVYQRSQTEEEAGVELRSCKKDR